MKYEDTSWLTIKVKDRLGNESIIPLDTLRLDPSLIKKDDRYIIQLTPQFFLAEEFIAEDEAKDAIVHLIEIGKLAITDTVATEAEAEDA